jgi:hypothetical protein
MSLPFSAPGAPRASAVIRCARDATGAKTAVTEDLPTVIGRRKSVVSRESDARMTATV